MNQFQTNQNEISKCRLSNDDEQINIQDGDVLLKIDHFAFTSNNITYAVIGHEIGYWQFFPAINNDEKTWGIIPVWGFADVVKSKNNSISVGERLYGYFPAADHMVMTPAKVSENSLIDGAAHRAALPPIYNRYQRVQAESNYKKEFDAYRMLFTPLYMTSYFIWDRMKMNDWYQAEQVIVLSASSKTSIGVAYAFAADQDKHPKLIGMTSSRNFEKVKALNLYEEVLIYEELDKLVATSPTAIVDMSGNMSLMANLHTHFGDQMKKTIQVGMTHWKEIQPKEGFIKERSEFFFAPSQVQLRMKEWGPEKFNKNTFGFLMDASMKSAAWIKVKTINGLDGLSEVYQEVMDGQLPADVGLVVKI